MKDLVVLLFDQESLPHLINTSTTITRKMMIMTKMARIPLKIPMMLPYLADGSVSPCVVVTAMEVAQSVVMRIPVKSH